APAYQGTLLMRVFRRYLGRIVSNLEAALHQKLKTSKLPRKLRALAHILEDLTGELVGEPLSRPDTETTLGLLDLVLQAQKAAGGIPEAKTCLVRAETRLRRWLMEGPRYERTCVACGEGYNGSNHTCTNAAAKAKDLAMGRDPDLK